MRTVVFLVLLGATMLPAAGARAQSDADKAMARQISTHLKQSGQLRNYRIGVTCRDGIASLSGTVASAEQLETAIRLAEQVSGVSQVVSELQFPSDGEQAVGPRTMANTFGRAQQASSHGQQSPVMHASGNNAAAFQSRGERSPLLSRTTSPNSPQARRGNMPLPAPRGGMNPAIRQTSAHGVYPAGGAHAAPSHGGAMMGAPMGPQVAPAGFVPHGHGRGPSYDNAQMPGYAWPSYASYPNYAALSYPQQYSPTAWPYIGPFYPYPQVPLAWRKVSLEWDDGWWFLDFSAHNSSH